MNEAPFIQERGALAELKRKLAWLESPAERERWGEAVIAKRAAEVRQRIADLEAVIGGATP
jgi:hypothetical protein